AVGNQILRVNVLKERPRKDNFLSIRYSTGIILVYRNEHPGYIEPREEVWEKRVQINFNSEKGLNGSTVNVLKKRLRKDNFLSIRYSTGIILVYRNEHPGYIELVGQAIFREY
ncbi:237_t:CDS:2, partial [Funneliformis mosseae]